MLMKSKLFSGIFVLLILSNLIQAGTNDTLKLYNPATVSNSYYSTSSFPTQVARFDLPSPAYIKGFIITVRDTGSMVMKFCGHEGGVALATLYNPLVPPITITNNTLGVQKIIIKLQDSVPLYNDQFFLQFSGFKGKIKPVTDRTNHAIPCSSASGGEYRYQYGKDAAGTLYLLYTDNRAFAIDVILEYMNKTPHNYFTDITDTAGFPTTLSNSSVAAGDYNNDNFPDLLISGRLFRNNTNSTFTDVTTTLGIKNKYSGIGANAFIDMDNDGDQDIILFGGDTSVLLVNSGGTFTEKILHLPNFKAFLSFSFADINNDKYPDLFVSQLWQTYPQPEPNYFFYNDKNLDFTDNTTVIYSEYDGTWNWPSRAWNPANSIVERNRNSRGSQWVDFDNDGDLDLFVTNYFLQPDEFYRNEGDGTFTDICYSKKIDVNSGGSNHGTGVDWYDYNNDGNIDLLLCQFAHPHFIAQGLDHRGTAIYKNNGPPNYTFTDIVGQYGNYTGLVSPSGLELEETHAGGAWGDIDNDGLADFLMTVFYGCRYIELYHQKPDHTFELVTYDWGLKRINTGTDLVWVDFDGDGKLDLAGADNGQFRLYKNTFPARNFIELNLRSTSANKFAIGARVTLYASGQKYTQEVCAGRGEKMQKPYTLHFGLQWTPTIDSVVVLWPTKPQKKEVFTGLQVEKTYLLTEGGAVVLGVDPISTIDFSLYPNPSTKKITIGLNLIRPENTTIVIYNALMQKVAILSDNLLGNGNHQFVWEAQNSGIYFCQINTGAKSVTKKFVITEK